MDWINSTCIGVMSIVIYKLSKYIKIRFSKDKCEHDDIAIKAEWSYTCSIFDKDPHKNPKITETLVTWQCSKCKRVIKETKEEKWTLDELNYV